MTSHPHPHAYFPFIQAVPSVRRREHVKARWWWPSPPAADDCVAWQLWINGEPACNVRYPSAAAALAEAEKELFSGRHDAIVNRQLHLASFHDDFMMEMMILEGRKRATAR